MRETSPATLVEHLRREQANAMYLYLQYKGYHWNVSGPYFRELHLLFDEHAKTILETVDELAERQRMRGARAPYTVDELRELQRLPHEEGLPASDQAMIARLCTAHLEVIAGLKAGFLAAEAIGDPGSADLFARTVQAHEKMEWFLREHLTGHNARPVEPLPKSVAPAAASASAR